MGNPVVSVCLLAVLAVPAPGQVQEVGKPDARWFDDLRSDDAVTREHATRMLGGQGLGVRDRARALTKLLDDGSARERRHAAEALGFLGEAAASAAPRLSELREKDPDVDVRRHAAIAWIRVQVDARRVPALIDELGSKEWGVCLAATEVLSRLGSEACAAAPALAKLLDSADPIHDRVEVFRFPESSEYRGATLESDIRATAAEALGAVCKGSEDFMVAVPALVRALRHDRPYVRSSALRALGDLGEPARKAIPEILARLKDSDPDCRAAAVGALDRLLDSEDAESLDVIVEALAAVVDDGDHASGGAASTLGIGLSSWDSGPPGTQRILPGRGTPGIPPP